MKKTIEKYKDIVIQIATPYSLGTGFYLKDEQLIVTNEHVVRDNKEVVIDGNLIEQQLANILFLDKELDIAFIEAPGSTSIPRAILGDSEELKSGDVVMAVGHPFGLKYSATKGIVSNPLAKQNETYFIQHDAALNPGNSGGPLLNENGQILGINTFGMRNGNSIGFALPVKVLSEAIQSFLKAGRTVSAKCFSCGTIVDEENISNKYCPSCGYVIKLPSAIESYEPYGMSKTIESMLRELNHTVALTRRGPNCWEIKQGSAKIKISYHEETGLIMGDAFLCTLPKSNVLPIYEFILKENPTLEGLTFSAKGPDIILSLLIFDKYFNMETGKEFFDHLFKKADHYDNILIEKFGGLWRLDH